MRDAVVVGGGPAGSATALQLAARGWDVLLLDRARFPRDKPCGEFLTPAARTYLEALGVWRELRDQGLSDVPSMRIVAPSGRAAEYRTGSDDPAGYSIRRTKLDAILLNAARSAGVEIREGVSVRGLVLEEKRVVGVAATMRGSSECESVRARLVVGADGTHSVVARTLGIVRPIPRMQRIAIVSHWNNLRGSPNIEMRSAKGLVCGVGSLAGESANVTVVARTSEAAQIAGRPVEFLQGAIAGRFPDLAERLESATREPAVRTVGCFAHVTKRASVAGAMLVGDAATFVDPFTGEGVYFGLSGARMAAEVADECLRAGDLSERSLARYDARRQELKQRYLLCGIVQAVVRTPPLLERVVRSCGREPLTLARLMQGLGDGAPPGDILRPSFAARLLR